MENQNQNPKTQLIERLKESNNVLVTVSKNPSVDQLSAAIGLTIMLNHLGKHATAVFSGQVPNTLEFLKPEDTIEKTTDSLRDFIISLDKSKADKLRYKVEDKMVKIFITPYRTSLTEADLVFGQGDFNVDAVVAIGVQEKDDLDEAIVNHGRILHDVTVITVNTTMSGQLGAINWVDAKASSLCEMIVPVCETLKANALDAQMATAFLTGIVAETDRFSNEKTSSDTMNISAKLMAAGANQQLVATKLEEPAPVPVQPEDPEIAEAEAAVESALDKDGSLSISHADDEIPTESADLPDVQSEIDRVLDDTEQVTEEEQYANEPQDDPDKPSRLILHPPSMGGTLTANSLPEGLDPSTDPMTVKANETPLLRHDRPEQEEATKKLSLEPQLEDIPFPQTMTPPSQPEPPVEQVLPPELPVETPPSLEQALPPLPLSDPVVSTEPAPVPEPVSQPHVEPPVAEMPTSSTPPEVPAEVELAVEDQTLTDLESAVDSPHLDAIKSSENVTDMSPAPDPSAALAAAHQAFDSADTQTLPRPEAFNASAPLEVMHEDEDVSEKPVDIHIDPSTGRLSYPTNLVPPSNGLPSDPTAAHVADPTAPPPVPPPMAMPPMMPPSAPFPRDGTLPPVPQ